MSHTETRIGKMILRYSGNDIEGWCKNKCESDDKIPSPEDFDEYFSWKGHMYESYRERFVILEDEIYEVIEDNDVSHGGGILHMEEHAGVYSFILQWYNGGACFSEVVEDALKAMKEKENT